jgi:hypothetical protein
MQPIIFQLSHLSATISSILSSKNGGRASLLAYHRVIFCHISTTLISAHIYPAVLLELRGFRAALGTKSADLPIYPKSGYGSAWHRCGLGRTRAAGEYEQTHRHKNRVSGFHNHSFLGEVPAACPNQTPAPGLKQAICDRDNSQTTCAGKRPLPERARPRAQQRDETPKLPRKMNTSKNHAASVPVEHCCARGP